MKIRPILEEEFPQAEEIFRLCHPGEDLRESWWFFFHPTLVCVEKSQVLGITSFIIYPTEKGYIAALLGTEVHPNYQGCGIGKMLFASRQKLLENFGVTEFSGMAAADNIRMNKLHVEFGFESKQTISNAYKMGAGVVWEKHLV